MDGAASCLGLTAMSRLKQTVETTRHQFKALLAKIRKKVPPGFRLVLGLALMIGGVFAILPVLGLWMIPLGIAVAALDIVPLWRWIKARLF